MASSTLDNFISLFAVHQNVRNIAKQTAIYGNIGFIIDEGAELVDGESLPDSWFKARGINREDLKESISMRLPKDPYMHVWFHSWEKVSEDPQWPPVYNQIGCRCMSLLVNNVDQEVARVKSSFSEATILQEPIIIRRKWGPTATALMRDPEGNFLELLSIEGLPDPETLRPVPSNEKGFLHFMMNCQNFPRTLSFYQAFGMEHDSGVDFRKDGWPDGVDFFQKQYIEAFGSWPKWGDCQFLRGKRDPSYMHLELLEAKEELNLPGPDPTWSQRGIARYCIKVPDFEEELKKVKQRNNRIYIETQKGCLNWGDSIWAFTGDDDNHIVTLEQWMPHRHFGTRS